MKTKKGVPLLDQMKTAVLLGHNFNVSELTNFINQNIPKKHRKKLTELIEAFGGSCVGQYLVRKSDEYPR